MLKALIFDFDGVIVDTEPVHYRAFQEVLEPIGLGYSWENYVSFYMGFDDRDAFREAFKASGKILEENELKHLIEQKAHVFLEIVQEGIKPFPGVVELIRSLHEEIPLALCSGALISDIEPILATLGISKIFDVVITADDVTASKPDPSSYLLTLQKMCSKFPHLMIKPANCLAIEDTPAGIESAKGAGLSVIAVTNSYHKENLSGATLVVDSLEKITLQQLREIFVDPVFDRKE